MPHRRTTVDDGTSLHYRVDGTGPDPLVFVHGWCSNAAHWDRQLEHFASRHRVLAVDRRGHGRSDVPAGGYTPRRHAQDLAAVLAHERLRDTVVVAHAGGAASALSLASRRPDLVRALVLVDTTISPHRTLGRARSAARSPLGQLVDSLAGPSGGAAFEALYRTFFSPYAGAVADAAVRDAAAVPLRVARTELAGLAADTEGMARSLRQPVLWLTAGAVDEGAVVALIDDVQFGRVVGSGHFPHLEVPDQVNAMIERFLETRPVTASEGMR